MWLRCAYPVIKKSMENKMIKEISEIRRKEFTYRGKTLEELKEYETKILGAEEKIKSQKDKN